MNIFRGEYQGVPLGDYLLVDNSKDQRTINQIALELSRIYGDQFVAVKHKNFPQAVEFKDITLFLQELDEYWDCAKNLQYVFETRDDFHFKPRIAVKGAFRLTSLHLATPAPEDESEMRGS